MSDPLTPVDGWTIDVPPLTMGEIAVFDAAFNRYYGGCTSWFVEMPAGMVFTPADDTAEIDPPIEVGGES